MRLDAEGEKMTNAHESYELRQMQSLHLEAKIRMSQMRIRDWYDYWDGQVYISFSGGKDSTVLKHLVENTPGVYNVPSVFVDTGLEYPEVRKFATERADVVLRPEMRFDEVIKTYGYPVIGKEVAQMIDGVRRGVPSYTRKLNGVDKNGNPSPFRKRFAHYKPLVDAPFGISSQCCDVMKKKPAKTYEKQSGRKPYVGTMACESATRRQQWLKLGCNVFSDKNGRPVSKPLSFWTEQDILQYIQKFNLEYSSVYGDILPDESGNLCTSGCDRTGCMFCMFGLSQDGTPNRFQRMKKTHPRQYDYCMRPVEEKGLGLKTVLEYIGIPYE
jgi:3'-phosphoadenosine 5'-phosphosulfate sulfotransferase (PAPS reductase)/FAD synthetase